MPASCQRCASFYWTALVGHDTNIVKIWRENLCSSPRKRFHSDADSLFFFSLADTKAYVWSWLTGVTSSPRAVCAGKASDNASTQTFPKTEHIQSSVRSLSCWIMEPLCFEYRWYCWHYGLISIIQNLLKYFPSHPSWNQDRFFFGSRIYHGRKLKDSQGHIVFQTCLLGLEERTGWAGFDLSDI